jgi:hypothetical protein
MGLERMHRKYPAKISSYGGHSDDPSHIDPFGADVLGHQLGMLPKPVT